MAYYKNELGVFCPNKVSILGLTPLPGCSDPMLRINRDKPLVVLVWSSTLPVKRLLAPILQSLVLNTTLTITLLEIRVFFFHQVREVAL
jgi:hypothetical protein